MLVLYEMNPKVRSVIALCYCIAGSEEPVVICKYGAWR